MTAEPHLPADPLTLFQGGATSHPARQAWLLEQLEQWFAGDLADGRDRRRIVAQALRAATEDAHRWLDERLDGCDLVRVDLHLEGEGGPRHSVFPSLPSPLGLLLICLDQCRVGDEVRIVQQLAKAGRVEATATWPFGMDEAETLTRPARHPAAVHSG
jgi:hypothetical protein